MFVYSLTHLHLTFCLSIYYLYWFMCVYYYIHVEAKQYSVCMHAHISLHICGGWIALLCVLPPFVIQSFFVFLIYFLYFSCSSF